MEFTIPRICFKHFYVMEINMQVKTEFNFLEISVMLLCILPIKDIIVENIFLLPNFLKMTSKYKAIVCALKN